MCGVHELGRALSGARPDAPWEGLAAMVIGLAAKMKSELAALAARHNVAPPVPITVPMAPACLDDIVVEGYAATKSMPLDRVRLRHTHPTLEGG